MTSKFIDSISDSKNSNLQELARAQKALGNDIADLSTGELYHPPSEILVSILHNADLAQINKYTDTIGTLQLRQSVAEHTSKKTRLDFTIENTAITTGAKQALYNVFQCILDVNDSVLIPTPYWTSFQEQAKLARGKPIHVPLKPNNYQMTIDDVEKYIDKSTKAILINNPNNPTGVLYEQDKLSEIVEYCQNKNVYIVYDDVYSDFIFDETPYTLSDIVINKKYFIYINSFSKSLSIAGVRLGFLCCESHIIKKIKVLQSHSTSNPSSISQFLLNEFLKHDEEFCIYTSNVRNELKENRNSVRSILSQCKDISFSNTSGGFYTFVELSNLIKIDSRYDGNLFAHKLLELYSTLVLPGSAFGYPNGIRLSFSGSKNMVETGTNNIVKLYEELF